MAREVTRTMIPPGTVTGPYKAGELESLIVANLTDEDYGRFQAAHITYSGATGKGAVNGYNGLGPYIATYFMNMQDAIQAMGWKHTHLEMRCYDNGQRQWIMRQQGTIELPVINTNRSIRTFLPEEGVV